MKILLLTDMPPCTNYTAGIVLSQIVKVLPPGSVACFCALDPTLQNVALDPELDWMPLEYAAKPRETGLRPGTRLGEVATYIAERVRRADAVPRLVDQCAAFARRHGCDTIWAVLEGQTMVRIVPGVADALGLPLYTHVWDPLDWWLKAFHVDRWTSRAAQAEFQATIRRSRAVATASNAMSAEYERLYGVRSVALIACHDHARSFAPEPRMRNDGELVIGMAGQFYANAEWQTLVRALNAADWTVGGRSARLLVLGHYVPDSPIPEGRSRFLGWVPQHEAIRILSEEADVLFCPYPFAKDMEDVSRLSFPSKLVSYLAAGRPVVFHGPDFAAPARYLKERGAGVVTVGSGAANVFNALERLATDPGCYAAVARAGRQAFLNDFTLERMRERALSFFETTMEALTPATPPRPFDHEHSAVRFPPPREQLTRSLRILRAGASVINQTPARPLVPIVVGARRRIRGWRRFERRPSVKTFRPASGVRGDVRRLQSTLESVFYSLEWRMNEVQAVLAVLKFQSSSLDARMNELQARLAETSSKDAQFFAEALSRIEHLRQENLALQARQREQEVSVAALTERQESAVSPARQRELEISVATLTEQLAASAKAYAQLAEVNVALGRRFDAVASSALAKMTFVEEDVRRLSREAGASAPVEGDGKGTDEYLDLLEGVLTGTLLGDASISPFSGPGYDPAVRMLGRDWPEHAMTMIGTVRMRNLRELLETALRDGVPGDVVETGVWRGGACIYARAILRAHGDAERRVWVADSFRGLPEPDAGAFPADAGDTHHTQGNLAVPADQVRANFARFGLLDDRVRFLEGWFKDTLPAAPIGRIALLRLDGDMYESTWQALEALYHKVSPGGFVIVDDYVLPACAKAVDDWRERHGITAPLIEVDGAAVYWRHHG